MTTAEPTGDRGKPKCGGKRRGEGAGQLCTRPAGWGTDHAGTGRCKLHGGSTRSHVTAGQKALAEKAVATFGLPREIDPRDALLEEVYRTAGAVDWLHQQVQALQANEVVWGVTEEVTKDAGEFPGVDTTRAAEVNIWVHLWQRERAHLVKVAKEAISAGIEERKVRLAEQQGAMLAGVIKAILGDLDLTPEQQAKVGTVVPRHLRAVA
ncbi:hypothetical protein [Micromonospora tulbaghiae]|uniref:hypothetical protein n=1 Tax=Micromonospora tulbaghiae TaxID=479978 RepID=UPI003400D6D5